MDAMSVCMGIGVRWHGPHQRFRMAWHMGLFQFLMPILGWLGGEHLARFLVNIGGYIASALVLLIGIKMLYEALKSHPGAVAESAEHAAERAVHMHPNDPTRGWSLVMLSVATSIDALVVGFSLGLKQTSDIWLSAAVIGFVAAGMALAGIVIGKRLGERLGKAAEIIGAAVLIALGLIFPFI